MRSRRAVAGMAVVIVGLLAAGATVGVTASADGDDRDGSRVINVRLSGYQEDPLALSTTGTGKFRIVIDEHSQTIDYTLTYANLEGNVLQAHIHLGGRAQSGGISAFLCSNLGNGPAGTPACPPAPATVEGTIDAADVVGPTPQGIAPGEFAELLDAIRAKTTYVNVHSSKYPGGEIRSQLVSGRHHH
jgi:hypothetical protein